MKALTLAFLSAWGSPLAADVVFLKGGQRIEGKVEAKGDAYEVRTDVGTFSVSRSEVVKIVKSAEELGKEADALHRQARALYEAALAIQNDPKATNAKLREALEILQKAANLLNEALETYADPKHVALSEKLVVILQERRLYRDKMSSERGEGPPSAPEPTAKPEPQAPEPSPPSPEPEPPAALPAPRPKPDITDLLARAKAGDAEAQHALGTHYEGELKGKEALKWYRSAADKKHPRALVRLGTAFLKGLWGSTLDFKEARKCFQRAADQGEGLGWFSLGVMEFDAPGGRRNLVRADSLCEKGRESIQKAAEQGDPEALGALGWMYLEGMGIGGRQDRALACLQRAAALGHADSMIRLGDMLLHGRGVDRDLPEAFALYLKAAEAGSSEGFLRMSESYYYGGLRPRAELSQEKTLEWLLKGAELEHVPAFAQLGRLHIGQGVPIDGAEGVKWLRKGAERKSPECYCTLGVAYYRGVGVPKDVEEARKWLKLACAEGNTEAMRHMAGIEQDKEDFKEAVRWYRAAAERGDSWGQIKLAGMYEYGIGIPKDPQQARRWYLQAAQQGDGSALLELRRKGGMK